MTPDLRSEGAKGGNGGCWQEPGRRFIIKDIICKGLTEGRTFLERGQARSRTFLAFGWDPSAGDTFVPLWSQALTQESVSSCSSPGPVDGQFLLGPQFSSCKMGLSILVAL